MKKYLSAVASSFALAALVAVLIPGITHAQAPAALQAVPCFDYYDFGSVQVDIAPLSRSVPAGTSITFSGSIKNANAYPIVDGAVYVKIFRKTPAPTVLDDVTPVDEGGDVVDQFFAVQSVTLGANSQKPVSFSWKVPSYARDGSYEIATYFVSASRFNLLGLSFTDDVVGNTADFSVSGEQTIGLSFDKTAVTVNSQSFAFAAFNPEFTKDEPIAVTAPLKNTTHTAQTATVKYTLYSWDGLRTDQVIATKKESITVPAGASGNASYTISDTSHAVYYLVIEADYQDTKSILDVRMVRQGVDRARINFVSPASYPLVPGSPNNIFVCVHNAGLASSIDGQRVVLSVSDAQGKSLSQAEYSGPITGSIMGFLEPVTVSNAISDFTVSAEIYSGTTLVERADMRYSCQDIDSAACATTPAAAPLGGTATILVVLLIAIVSIVLLIAILNRKQHGVIWHLLVVILAVIAILSILAVGLLYSDRPAQAQINNTEQYTYSHGLQPPENSVLWDDDSVNIGLIPDLASGGNLQGRLAIKVAYGATMQKISPSAIHLVNGDTVSVGDIVKFSPVAFDPHHIAWFVSGSVNDSPYGYWRKSTGPLPDPRGTDRCPSGSTSYTGILQRVGNNLTCNRIVITEPVVTIQSVSANLRSNADGTYTVIAAGPISATVAFASTAGYEYATTEMTTYYCDPHSGGFSCRSTVNRDTKNRTYTVPAQTIAMTLNGIAAPAVTNKAPTVPAWGSAPGTACTSSSTSFSVSSTDPDNDSIYYEFVFDGDTSAPVRTPASGYVTSGTSQSTSKSWSTQGTHTVKARAIDINGNSSAYNTSRSVVVASCTPDNPGTPDNPPGNPGNPPGDPGTGNPPTEPPGQYSSALDLFIAPNPNTLNAISDSTSQTVLNRYRSLIITQGDTFSLRWVDTYAAAGYTCSLAAAHGATAVSNWTSYWSSKPIAGATIYGLPTLGMQTGDYSITITCTKTGFAQQKKTVKLTVNKSSLNEF